MNKLKIYKSSAGSGKTFALVKEYLRIVLQNPADYKHILAITFTNKATGEMKSRVINALVSIAEGNETELKKVLQEESSLPSIEKRARQALDFILHDYSSFSISTIDSFFQKILRGIAREINLPVQMRVELNEEDAIEAIIDNLFDDVGKDKELTRWLTELYEQTIVSEGKWNIEYDLKKLARHLFSSQRLETLSFEKEKIRNTYQKLLKIKSDYESTLAAIGKKALAEIQSAGYTVKDFAYGETGVAGFFQKLINHEKIVEDDIGTRILAAAENPGSWVIKSSKQRQELIALVEDYLILYLHEALDIIKKESIRYQSAVVVQQKIYLLGIYNDLHRKLAHYRNEKNLLFLSDTPQLLNRFITNNDTSFVFEKTGTRYKHILIDEFQDTSSIQWLNLLPLIVNSLGSGHFSMVVGDAKQSIYRWRGGDINLLTGKIKNDLVHFKSITQEKNLNTNYRSRRDIVSFNNDFFSSIPSFIQQNYPGVDAIALNLLFGENLKQEVASKNNNPGCVKINFLNDEEVANPEQSEETVSVQYEKQALQQLYNTILDLCKKKYRYEDIAILVRSNLEGNRIATFLAENKITQVISPDSLLIVHNPKVIFLVNTLRYILDNKNHIARSELLFYYTSTKPALKKSGLEHELFTDYLSAKKRRNANKNAIELFNAKAFDDNLLNKLLPEDFINHLPRLSKIPLYEAAEHLVRIFQLDSPPDAYVQRFLDLVLEFSNHQYASIQNFLEWWAKSNTSAKASVLTPQEGDSIRIMTIHKSKGLQFPVVLIPFCNWSIEPQKDETIWVQSEEEPYKQLGDFPLKSTAKLKSTFFNKTYQKELLNTLTDNINLLYVAFTRAEDQLHIWSKKPSTNNIKKCNELLWNILSNSEKLKPNFLTTDTAFYLGEENIIRVNKTYEPLPVEMTEQVEYKKVKWQEKLTIKARLREFSDKTDTKSSAISYGLLIHKILSEIIDSSELDKTLSQTLFEGLITEAEKEQLHKHLSNFINHNLIKPFFEPGKKILTEREVLLPDGRVLRPDRVILEGTTATIVDFKTGEQSEKHQDQIKEYANELNKMGYLKVKSYLVYIKTMEVVEIP